MERDEKACPFCAETIKAAAVVCKHCGRELKSSEGSAAKPLFPGEAPLRRPGMTKWWLWVPLGLAAFVLVVGTISNSTPEGQAKLQDRRVYELCLADMRDELRSRQFRDAARSMCERLRDDFVKKYGREP